MEGMKKGVFTDAKISPKLVAHPYTFTDGDAWLRGARKKCDADPVSSKSRNLSTQIDYPAV